ncbi:sporulation protein YpjB [Paraliobacillus sp. X-1268]|uniref:sporulation protein YpjB n=1 Tax=Paraliobacillus sp. X-1268 TaxID=2213193 RepID=UPI00130095BB|nr:sporulation protein YpjB [Paraliobacillus sp. X-1268]
MKHWKFQKKAIITSLTILLCIVLYQLFSELDADEIEASSIAYQYERYITEERYQMANNWLKENQEVIRLAANTDHEKSQAVIGELIHENLEIVNDTSIGRVEKLHTAMSLVIALDALEHNQQPIWVKTKESLHQTVESVLAEGLASDSKRKEIISQWEIIQPTLSIMLEEEDYYELVSSYNRLYDVRSETNMEPFQVVFRQAELMDITIPAQQSAYLSFYWIILIVGGVIILTLTYVAWRKYKGQKKKKQKQHNS